METIHVVPSSLNTYILFWQIYIRLFFCWEIKSVVTVELLPVWLFMISFSSRLSKGNYHSVFGVFLLISFYVYTHVYSHRRVFLGMFLKNSHVAIILQLVNFGHHYVFWIYPHNVYRSSLLIFLLLYYILLNECNTIFNSPFELFAIFNYYNVKMKILNI